MSNYHIRTVDAAQGKWRGVLLELGVPSQALRNRHGPCPMCGGKDRFRFDDREGTGTWICNQCGSGDGMELAKRYTGKEFREVAAVIDGIVNNVKAEAAKPELSGERRLAMLREVAAQTVKVSKGDLVDLYLTARGIGEPVAYPAALRFAPKLSDGEGFVRPAMVATVKAPDGSNATLHRTFLRPDGLSKAEMERPRKLMPGDLPEGSAVRLADWTGSALGIAEGIETALACSHRWEMPVWAALNAGNLAKWTPPEGCTEVAIFADHDPTWTGHAAAYRLANRLCAKGIVVTVHIPEKCGTDWADVWLSEQRP